MRFLGIDYGDKRTGIAVSDDDGRIAFPRGVAEAGTDRRRIQAIKTAAKREYAQAVILGLPVEESGKEGPSAQKVRAFGKKLERALSLPIFFQNELLTTRIASVKPSGEKGIDAQAAAIILQSYLDNR